MKKLLIVFTTFLFSFGFSQVKNIVFTPDLLIDNTLNIDKLLGLDKSQESYVIKYVIDTPDYAYGNRLSFNDSMFYSFYTAPCGNDYFTSLYGPYRIVDGNILEINVQVIEYHGEWDPPKPKEFPGENWQRFKVITSEEGFVFERL